MIKGEYKQSMEIMRKFRELKKENVELTDKEALVSAINIVKGS